MRIGISYGSPSIIDGRPAGPAIEKGPELIQVLQGSGLVIDSECHTQLQPDIAELDNRQLANGEAAYVYYDTPLEGRTAQPPGYNNAMAQTRDPDATYEIKNRIMELQVHGMTRLITPDIHTFSIGRDKENDLVIQDERVSRRHLTIERQGKDFYMINHSQNGICYQTQDDNSTTVNDKSLIPGSCTIGLGPDINRSEPNVIKIVLH